jgi:hypothetical protein
MVFSADNGGPIYRWGDPGANNFPLRGGKASNWEGGIRVNAFVSGGAVPVSMQGTKATGLIALWDWYGARFRQKFTLEDAIGSHACSLEANTRVANGIPLGSSPLLPVDTVNCVATPKVCYVRGAGRRG